MKILSIDPSVANRAGWASFDTDTLNFNWGHWELSGINFKVRCVDLKDRINETFPEGFDEFVAEWPCYYNSEKGRIAAQQGYTINLAGLVMYIIGWFQIPPIKTHLYTAPQWKGSVPKQVTARRFFRLFNIEPAKLNHDIIDATMMLVYHLKEKRIWD